MKNRKKLLKLLIIYLAVIILPFSLNSCTKVVVQTKYIYVKPKRCDKPVKPVYKLLDVNKSLCSSYNINALLFNLMSMKLYVKQLENTISCYENQINIDNNTK